MNKLFTTISNIHSTVQTTDYITGSNLLANLHKIQKLRDKNYSSFLLLSDKNIFNLYGEKIIASLNNFKKPILISLVEPGEKSKNLSVIPKIVKPFFQNGLDRKSVIVAMGGGVITDLGGFIASILLRGIDSIYIPTTLLSQVDAAIGGKNGVNFHDNEITYKNMLGSFYQPKMVISDIDTLKTLPGGELTSGLGEIVKYWIGWGKSSLDQISKIPTCAGRKAQKDEMLLSKIIIECQKIKLDIVEQDPFETKGERQKLNLGHTIGHALEGTANGKLSHGEAVSIGLAAAAKISLAMKILNEKKYKSIIDNITRLGLPTRVPAEVGPLRRSDLLKGIKLDKKSGEFVLIKDIGDLITGVKVEMNIINQVLEEIVC